jgi:hypothetical protein
MPHILSGRPINAQITNAARRFKTGTGKVFAANQVARLLARLPG